MGWTDPWRELDEYERCYWRRVAVVILLALALAMLLGALPGCAAPDAVTTSVCYLSPLGQTEEGYAVVLQACQSPEAFRGRQ